MTWSSIPCLWGQLHSTSVFRAALRPLGAGLRILHPTATSTASRGRKTTCPGAPISSDQIAGGKTDDVLAPCQRPDRSVPTRSTREHLDHVLFSVGRAFSIGWW